MVQGIENIRRLHRQIPVIVRDEVSAAIEKKSEQIVREMKQIAPRGRSRRLIESIGWSWGRSGRAGVRVRRSPRGQQFGRIGVTIFAGGRGAFYARFQEFGTKNMAANPFFFPVWRANRRSARAVVNAAVRRAFKRINSGRR